MKRCFFILMLFIIALPTDVYSQCCAAGNPVSSDDSNLGNNEGSIKIALQYKTSSAVNYYHGSVRNNADFLSKKKTTFDFSSFSLSYGVSDRLIISGDLGFFFNKGETLINQFHPETGEPFSRSAKYDLGDASLSLSYILFESKNGKWAFIPQYKSKFPVGSFNTKDWVGVLPIDLQPSTGSMRYNPGFMVFRKITKETLSLTGLVTAEYIDKITMESGNVYKYGNIYSFSISAYYKPFKSLSFNVFNRYEIRGKRIDNSKEIQHGTGGTALVFAGKISYIINPGFIASLMYDRPIYRYMNFIEGGTGQLGNLHMISLKLSKKINIKQSCSSLENS